MSGAAAIAALHRAEVWPEPILMPVAARLGARLDGRDPAELPDDPQALADACLSAARFLGADAVWVSALAPDGGADIGPELVRDAATRAIAAARAAGLGAVVELRGPLARALADGGDDAALKAIKPAMIAAFEAIAQLRPDIIVLAEPEGRGDHGESRARARLYGALKRLAGHYDILIGLDSAPAGLPEAAAPDLAFGGPQGPGRTDRAQAIAPDWGDGAAFAGAVAEGLDQARSDDRALIVSGRAGLTGAAEPEAIRTAVQGIRARA